MRGLLALSTPQLCIDMTRHTVAAWKSVIFGILVGALLYHAILLGSGTVLVDQQTIASQRKLVAALKEDNRRLTDDLFGARRPTGATPRDSNLPYNEEADARAEVAAAREMAVQDAKFLMITFGANWCIDCRTLYRSLGSEVVAAYTKDRFLFANVDVGEFNRNLDVAAELGVSLEVGIPVAIFFDQLGEVIGTTSGGELEPARLYTSNQILKFIRDIAERELILAPNAIR